jgi:hypothetical protein
MRVGNTARDARALASDVARLRTDIERYRAELRAVVDRCLDECGHCPASNEPGHHVRGAGRPCFRSTTCPVYPSNKVRPDMM